MTMLLKAAAALALGLLFGFGLLLSEMTNPAKVLNFLDITDIGGLWDPSLVFVLGAALGVALVGYRLVLRRKGPLLGAAFDLPTRKTVDAPLLVGAAAFGVGWGIGGLCPGPALAGVAAAPLDGLVFVAAMVVGAALARMARK